MPSLVVALQGCLITSFVRVVEIFIVLCAKVKLNVLTISMAMVLIVPV